jgi:hypothetical protein
MYDSYILSEWWGSIKSSSVACPNKAGTKQRFATCKESSNKEKSRESTNIKL